MLTTYHHDHDLPGRPHLQRHHEPEGVGGADGSKGGEDEPDPDQVEAEDEDVAAGELAEGDQVVPVSVFPEVDGVSPLEDSDPGPAAQPPAEHQQHQHRVQHHQLPGLLIAHCCGEVYLAWEY